ncbi:MAG: ATP-binding cassette domain-containing protein, partial [Woeseia sp.]|nr:ATP-binding cassette domain-containing protein [Woeseia sp.]
EPVAPFSGGEKARLVLALMISQAPNLLLLDEPTNHLDLEMRQALSMALIEYSGALVVISHDRHLLRSVCDELLIVHDGIVDRFDRSLDEYPAWLKEQEAANDSMKSDVAPEATPTRQLNKKEKRRLDAERRQRLKPLTDKVRKIEDQLGKKKSELQALEERLADEALYADSTRQEELAALSKEQAQIKVDIETLEWSWMEASEAVEKSEQY